jgi:tRNA threonylcarbamoyladenosine biosynthesis protein TsaE
LRFASPSPEATRAAARALATCVEEAGLVLVVSGPLGAGKTCFVQGLAEGLGLDPARVTSPTFTVASEYELPPGGRARRLAHVDLYRLEDAGEVDAAGFPDLLAPGVVVAIEWGERFPEVLPPDRLTVALERPEAGFDRARRVLKAWASGAVAEAALRCWRERLALPPR